MAAAREAIGGENRLKGVKALQVTGTFRRVIDANDTEGDFEVFLELPDKYLRSEKTGTPGRPSTERIEALVGTEMRDVVRGGGGGGRGAGNPGGDAHVGDQSPGGDGQPRVDNDDNPPAGGNADQPPTAEAERDRAAAAADSETQRRVRQADVARLLTMWLLTTSAPMTWVGIAESPDGKADVLETRFADGQPTRLFLDVASHMPLMLQWQSMTPSAGGRRGGQRGRGPGSASAGAAGQRQGGPSAPVAFDMTFSDHRVVNGIKLPHVITRGTNGKTIERWSIRIYRVNPSLNPDTFTR